MIPELHVDMILGKLLKHQYDKKKNKNLYSVDSSVDTIRLSVPNLTSVVLQL